MIRRPVILCEEPIERRGNKAVCQDCGGRCMCQPENHPGGKGACGKAIAPVVDADIQNQYLAARGRV